MRRLRPPRLGLRARSSVAFALVGLALSLVLATFTYNRSRGYLIDQREADAISQATFNARLVANGLRASSGDPARLLSSVATASGSQPLLYNRGLWYVTVANLSPSDLPSGFRRTALSGRATRQRFQVEGEPRLAVAIPISGRVVDGQIAYVETTSLRELEGTLKTLAASLSVGAAVATLVGATLGLFASRRIVRPLAAIAATAERIESGDLSARLENRNDRDLAPLIGSFNSMAQSLEERIQRERRFASHVSHELRSPLTSLRGAMDLVVGRGAELPERARVGIEILDQQVDRFERMVLDLLEIARIEAGAASVDLVPLRVGPLLTSALRHLGVTCEILMTEKTRSAHVLVDVRRFERVMANLTENANRHGGGLKAIVTEFDESTDEPSVRIHVDDAGPGVPPEERIRIFERFARGARGRHLPGAGLGLALVSEHLRLMDGTIEVSDSPQGGARFTLHFPINQSVEES